MTWQMEIVCKAGLDKTGKAVRREAVRAVILRGSQLLMIHSSQNGDYKFPGGGMETGEAPEETLRREIEEECGAVLSGISGLLGVVTEYDQALEPEADVFIMTSAYYLCSIHEGMGVQRLDPYEAELGFTPVWIELDQALHANHALLETAPEAIPRWVLRETTVLERLKMDRLGGV